MTLAGGVGSFALGACLGSLANYCIDRLPKDSPPEPSRFVCEDCGASGPLYHRLPVVGYLLARGKCAECGSPASRRTPLVETSSGLLALACYAQFGASWLFISNSILLVVALTAGIIDWRHQVIPDTLTIPALAAGLAFSLLPGRPGPLEALLGLAVAGGLLAAIALVYPQGMGGGDVKFMAMAGAFLGWTKAFVAVFLASLAGALVGLTLIWFGLRGRKDPLPFGPFLAFGVLAAVFVGYKLLG